MHLIDVSRAQRKAELRRSLENCRQQTEALFEQVPDQFLRRRVHSFYSPIGWHFGHVGRTEEYWVLGQALRRPLLDDRLTFLFADLKDNPKDNRVNIPDRSGILEYLHRTRARVLEALEDADLSPDDPYLADGYAWEFAVQHEYQHQETILEMLQLIRRELGPSPVSLPEWKPDRLQGVRRKEPAPTSGGPESNVLSDSAWVDLAGGEFEMGSANLHFYDNEKQPHTIRVEPFRLAVAPVTAFEWTEFMADGGYRRPELWTAEGWAWRCAENANRPEYWFPQGDGWAAFGPAGARAIEPDEPAASLSWFEADAYARWAGKRLPTEAEWEWARRTGAGGCGSAALSRGYGSPPPVTVEAPDRLGLLAMTGSVWQWTSSRFLPYPGFVAFPYDGYSWDHMKGQHYVCRGGSWATAEPIRRPTFRNWYVPTYRQGFLGLRLADSEPGI